MQCSVHFFRCPWIVTGVFLRTWAEIDIFLIIQVFFPILNLSTYKILHFSEHNIFFSYLQEVDLLKLHKKTVHVDKTKLDFKCEKCDFASYAKGYVLAHFQKVHVKPPELKHVCECCGKRFLYPSHLKSHMKYFHGSGDKKKTRIRKKIIIEKPGSL